MIVDIFSLGLLAAASGLLLGFAAVRFKVEGDPIVEQIDSILPQTQCGQCGYAGCRPYAEAIAAGEADINQCPPGGEGGVIALAELLGRDPKPLNPENGAEKPKMLAVIDEQNCIGCTLCLQACPVDAILGAAQHMHTVIARECTGCELCLAPCPVDCIDMVPFSGTRAGWEAWSAALAEQALQRYTFHQFQVARAEQENAERLEDKARHKLEHLEEQSQHTDPVVLDKKRAIIAAALAKAKARREGSV